MDIGGRVHIDLSPNGGNYDQPHTDSPRVLHEDNHSGGYPATSAAVADFTVIGLGTAQITSQTDYACLHTNPRCLPPQRKFIVTITAR
ncbi:MAG: hypothetical protein M3Y73_06200 [Actinomycetota bacterium]|nr:hypothetical protein [Actinomycetota bacterium]